MSTTHELKIRGFPGNLNMKYIIGDWVEYRNTYARVFESFEDSYYLDSFDIIKFPKEDELTPIPLTIDILEKNGGCITLNVINGLYILKIMKKCQSILVFINTVTNIQHMHIMV